LSGPPSWSSTRASLSSASAAPIIDAASTSPRRQTLVIPVPFLHASSFHDIFWLPLPSTPLPLPAHAHGWQSECINLGC
jgi:hypothetical protein